METVIGTVQDLQGRFFAQDTDGNIVELVRGDAITEGMRVIGSDDNSANSFVNIAMATGENVRVTGNGVQAFDSSLSSDELVDSPIAEESVNGENGVFKALEDDILEDTQGNEDESILDEGTEAGEEGPANSTGSIGSFAARDGSQTDVQADLRDADFPGQGRPFQEAAIPVEETTDEPVVTVTTPTPTVTADIDVSKADGSGTVTGSTTNATSIEVTVTGTDGTSVTQTLAPDANGNWTFDTSAMTFKEEVDYTVISTASDSSGNTVTATDVDEYDVHILSKTDIPEESSLYVKTETPEESNLYAKTDIPEESSLYVKTETSEESNLYVKTVIETPVTTGNGPHGISHVVILLENGTTVKIDEYSDDNKDYGDPIQYFDSIEATYGSPVETYIIKASTKYYDMQGNEIANIDAGTGSLPDWVDTKSNGYDQTDESIDESGLTGSSTSTLTTSTITYTKDGVAIDASEVPADAVFDANGEYTDVTQAASTSYTKDGVAIDASEVPADAVFDENGEYTDVTQAASTSYTLNGDQSADISDTDFGDSTDKLNIDYEASDTIDMTDLADSIYNAEIIDATDSEAQVMNLTLSDVLELTDTDNELTILGDDNKVDTLNVDTSGWTQDSVTSNSDGTTSYEYSNTSDSITLTVDDQIDTVIS